MKTLNGPSLTAGLPPDYQYARDDAFKTDFNIFGKADYKIGKVTLFADMQYRHIYYSLLGTRTSTCSTWTSRYTLIFLTRKAVLPIS